MRSLINCWRRLLLSSLCFLTYMTSISRSERILIAGWGWFNATPAFSSADETSLGRASELLPILVDIYLLPTACMPQTRKLWVNWCACAVAHFWRTAMKKQKSKKKKKKIRKLDPIVNVPGKQLKRRILSLYRQFFTSLSGSFRPLLLGLLMLQTSRI